MDLTSVSRPHKSLLLFLSGYQLFWGSATTYYYKLQDKLQDQPCYWSNTYSSLVMIQMFPDLVQGGFTKLYWSLEYKSKPHWNQKGVGYLKSVMLIY